MATHSRVILLFVFSFSVMAGPNIAIEKHAVDGIRQLSIVSNGNSLTLYTNTNEFDVYNQNTIGAFGLSNKKSLEKHLNQIDEKYTALKKINSKLIMSGKTFNELNPITRHETFIKVGEFSIPQSHAYYNQLHSALQNVIKKSKKTNKKTVKFIKGNAVSQLSYHKDGKEVLSENISLMFNCRTKGKSKVCTIDNYGHILVK